MNLDRIPTPALEAAVVLATGAVVYAIPAVTVAICVIGGRAVRRARSNR